MRPVAGEGISSFIERLAAANHLNVRLLRTYLRDPPSSQRGSPSWERLATATGREPSTLREILENTQCIECGAFLPPAPARGGPRQQCSAACRQRSYRKRSRKPPQQREAHTAPAPVPAPAPAPAPARSCDACGTRLERGSRKRWCSRRCKSWAYTRRRLDRGESPRPSPAPGAPREQQPTNCAACGCPLEIRSRHIRRTCSQRCRQRLYRLGRAPL
ncbi:TniQ family protein [Streptomyces globosus]|uniref:TniQ family protein n=1 Tax=Streptomyces globosus TaxID=68209 RepID=UPI003829AA4A